MLIELEFLENITVNNGARVIPRGYITRDFLAEYSLGVYVARYVTLTAQVNITQCDGVACPAAAEVNEL